MLKSVMSYIWVPQTNFGLVISRVGILAIVLAGCTGINNLWMRVVQKKVAIYPRE